MKKLSVTLLITISLALALSGCGNKNYIGADSAKKIAFENAGVAETDVKGLEVELDRETGKNVYEVNFDASGYEYEYEIDAESGDVVRQKRELDDDSRLPTPTINDLTPHDGNIETKEAEVTAAPEDQSEPTESEPSEPAPAAVTEPEVTNAPETEAPETKAPETKAPETKSPETKAADTKAAAASNEYIGRDKAEKAALDHAGYSASQVYDLESELDRERGVTVYDVSFDAEGYDYDYEIDAYTGEILRSDKEWDNDYRPAATQAAVTTDSTEYISRVKAKDIALNSAGLSESDIRDLDIELERENHRNGYGKHTHSDSFTGECVYYEVSFDSGSYDYEYDVDAVTGDILWSEKERD